MRNTITIRDIALEANVSIKTVSRVLNNEPNVRAEKRDAVFDAAKRLNYRPNFAARRLAGKRSYVIVHFYDNPNPDYIDKINRGVNDICRIHGFFSVAEPFNHKTSYSKQLESYLQEFDIDGVVLSPPLCDNAALLKTLKQHNIACLSISPHKLSSKKSSVYINEFAAAQMMTAHLINLGHKSMGFIAGPENHKSSHQRYQGFAATIKETGLKMKDQILVQGDFSVRSGFQAFEKLMRKKSNISAIFAANDNMSVGALMAAFKENKSIPQDLSIVGFDAALIGEQIWPQLTTISQPVYDMARRAAEVLIEQIEKPEQAFQSLEFAVEILHRDSCSVPS